MHWNRAVCTSCGRKYNLYSVHVCVHVYCQCECACACGAFACVPSFACVLGV